MKNLITLLILLGLVSCSATKKTSDIESQDMGIELADSDDFFDQKIEENDLVGASIEPLAENNQNQLTIHEASEMRTYTVQKNETLMLIAFKLYGDYARWRELASRNSDVLNNGTELHEGLVLNYEAPMSEFVWSPEGNPYLIKSGDNLGSISTDVYNTMKKWKLIWDNNRVLIKDPNKIFAGFTIYTPVLDDGSRDVATDNNTHI